MIASRFLPMSAVSAALILAVGFVSHAAPIRVGILNGVGTNRFWHTNIHTAASAIGAILADPSGANLGPRLVVPPEGFQFTIYGVANIAQCNAGGCGPTAEQKAAFISALDTLDVFISNQNYPMGEIFPNATDRLKLEDFSRRKGIVSLHASSDTYGLWPAWDSLQGARFINHPSSDRTATLHLDTLAKSDVSWSLLNRGLPDTANFVEEWLSFTTNGNVIRAVPHLKVLVHIDEASYAGGLGGARAMGADHPMSWYRELPEGGRFFYTALGHRAQNYTGTSSSGPTTSFVRRQIYNAIVWAAKRDSTGNPVALRTPEDFSRRSFGGEARIAGSVLTVSVSSAGSHAVELLTLDGKRIAVRRGHGPMRHDFNGVRAGMVYVLAIETPAGKAMRFIARP